MYLDKILGTKTKINVLSVLIAQPDRSIIENELAKEANVSISEVNRQIMGLVNAGLIIMERTGKAKVYHVNQQHFLYESLKSIFRNLEDVYREIANKVAKFVVGKHKLETVLLFGSVTTGKIRSNFVKEPSDIDIMVIVKDKNQIQTVKKDLLSFVSSQIFSTYAINVYPTVLSAQQYIAGLDEDAYIINVHSRAEVLYGQKPRRYS
jgi:predicted transcriptional regulator